MTSLRRLDKLTGRGSRGCEQLPPRLRREDRVGQANPTWKTILASARFGGLRCPSEVDPKQAFDPSRWFRRADQDTISRVGNESVLSFLRRVTIMGKSRKTPRTWGPSPAKQPRTNLSETLKAEIERKANELVETNLKMRFIQQPPKDPKYNYIIGLSTKWYGQYFYFVSTYACPGPNAISPTFDVNFARMEHTAMGRFHLAYLRHTGKWQELFRGQTLDECLASIRDDPWFQP